MENQQSCALCRFARCVTEKEWVLWRGDFHFVKGESSISADKLCQILMIIIPLALHLITSRAWFRLKSGSWNWRLISTVFLQLFWEIGSPEIERLFLLRNEDDR